MSFETAAGVAGLISLAIQASKELIKYYQACRGQDEQLDEITTSLERLTRVLAYVQDVLDPSKLPASVNASEVESLRSSLATQVTRLRNLAASCAATKTPKDAVELARAIKRRVLFPFKKETLRDAESIIRDIEAAITIALGVFNMWVNASLARLIQRSS